MIFHAYDLNKKHLLKNKIMRSKILTSNTEIYQKIIKNKR